MPTSMVDSMSVALPAAMMTQKDMMVPKDMGGATGKN
jgi:hypothetical protein